SLIVSILIIISFQLFSGKIIDMADAAAYGEDIVYSKTTRFQKIVMTRWRDDLRLYLNGNIQFSSYDEYRYHEALIHPLFSSLHRRERVLVLGGGDGLALREIFKYDDVRSVDLVDLDPAVVQLAKTNPHLKRLNKSSFHDRRVTYHAMDAWLFMRENTKKYDAVVVDLPDPSNENLMKLYSRQFYQLIARGISADGGVVIQSTSPYFNRRSFWSVVKTVKAAGLRVTPLHAHVPSFGEWGYVLAAHFNLPFKATTIAVPTRYVTTGLLPSLFHFPKDIGPVDVAVSTIDQPVIMKYYQEDNRKYFGDK
ncbi:hypothetical protein KKF84_05985, partial [Myxococcota bacterium]|nr:hypothetical protein [Myxococcota bacterium]